MRQALLLIGLALVCSPASATDDFLVIQAGGTQRTKCAMDIGSNRLADCVTIYNASDTQINPATNEAVDGLEATATAIDGHVDGIETLLGTTNSSLTTIDGRVDGIETLLGTGNTANATTNTNLGAPGDSTCGSDTGSCAINAKLSRIAERLTTINTSLATIDGRVDGLEASIGAVGDAAWTSGSGSLVALSKAVAGAAVDTTTPVIVKTDQTTHGTTDLVAADVTKIGGNAVSAGNGASGTGVQRVTLANDSTGIINQGGVWNVNVATATIRIASAAASTNLTAVSSSPCTILRVSGYNAAASARYLKFYNVASGSVTVGTTTIQQSFYLPATTAFSLELNRSYSTACSFALTTGSADNDTGALTSADVLALNVDYK